MRFEVSRARRVIRRIRVHCHVATGDSICALPFPPDRILSPGTGSAAKLRETASKRFAIQGTFSIAPYIGYAILWIVLTLDTLILHEDVMHDRAGVYWSTASNLADEMVRHANISFRTAHHVVGHRDAVAEAGAGG